MTDWIEGFVDYTSHLTSPEIFRRWGAIAIMAGAMERKVWVRTAGSDLYPNLYVVLVGNPGVGKSEVTFRAYDFWKSLPSHHIAHSSVTKAALLDQLFESARSVTRPAQVPAVLTYHALLISSNELGTLIPAYDAEFMTALTDIWDGKPYSESRRSRMTKIEIARPFLNMLAACTPGYLTSTLPETAWDMGFTSRTLFIYSGEEIIKSLFAETIHDIEREKALRKQLKELSEVSGKFQFTPEAASVLDNWHMKGRAPVPDHPKLFHYNSRRTAHLLKLCMIVSMSEAPDLIITLPQVQRAFDLLFEAEAYMPDIFKAMASSSHGKLLEEAWHFVYKAYNKANKAPVPAARLISFLSQRTPAHNVAKIIEVMENGGLIIRRLGKTGNEYVPAVPKDD